MSFDIGSLGRSRLGVGLAALGRPGYINLGHGDDLKRDYDVERMEERSHQVLDAAWAAGVRYFDAARSYGRAEDFLGHWLAARGSPPADVIVASKWGYTYTAGWSTLAEQHEVKEHSLEVLRRQIEESRARLGPHLGLYQIHSATLESGVLENRAVLAELERLRDGGLAIGVSVSGPSQGEVIRRSLEIEIGSGRLFSAVQATWNLLEPSAGTALRQAHDAGVAVIIKEGVANGRLTQRNRAADFAAKRTRLEGVGARVGVSLDAVALAAILAQPWVDVVLSGAATTAQLRANLAAVDLVLDEETVADLATLAESPKQYWARRAALAWN